MADVPIPLSALEHHMYCPRQCALIHVDGLWFDNEHTVRGTAGHRRVDSAPDRMERGYRILRHLPLWSEAHGLTGRADAVALSPDGAFVPIEYKVGSAHGATARVQLCAQALCLEEMFEQTIAHGFIWYSTTRRRTRVELDTTIRNQTRGAIAEIHEWMGNDRLPPAADDRRCMSCQFLDYCQPRLSAHPERVLRYIAEQIQCGS